MSYDGGYFTTPTPAAGQAAAIESARHRRVTNRIIGGLLLAILLAAGVALWGQHQQRQRVSDAFQACVAQGHGLDACGSQYGR